MNTVVTQFADSSSGLGSLGIDAKAFVIQLITFLLAFWVLKRFAFGPIAAMMERRRQTIEEGVALGEQMKKDKAALDARVAEELAKARTEADGIIAGAQETSREVVREAEEKATQKAAGILKAADELVASETQRARKRLEGEIVGLIADATEVIIGGKVDAKKDAQLIDRALKEQAA